MIRISNTVAAALLTAAIATPLAVWQGAQQTSPRMAFIDSREVIAQTPGRAEIAAQYAKEMAPIQASLKAISDSNDAMVAKYRADAPTLSVDARVSREKEMDDKRRGWQVKADSLNRRATERGAELERPMTDLLKKILDDIRQEEGYWMIIDLAVAEERGLIVAIDKNMDVTSRVLARYKVAAAALPKPGAPGGTGGAPLNTSTGVGRKIPPPGQ